MATDSGNKENDPREQEADLTADRDRVSVKKGLKVAPMITIEAAPITKSSNPFHDVMDSYNPSSNGCAPFGKRKGGSQEESVKRLRVERGRILNSNSAPTSDGVVSSCGVPVWSDVAAARKARTKIINNNTSSSSTSSSSAPSTSTTSTSTSSSTSSSSSTSLSVCDGRTNAVSRLITSDFDALFSPTVPIQNQNSPAITPSLHTKAVSMETAVCAPTKSRTSVDTSGKIGVAMTTHAAAATRVAMATHVTTATEGTPDTTSECPLPEKGEGSCNGTGAKRNGPKTTDSQSRASESLQNEEEGRLRDEEERMEWKEEGEEEEVVRAMAESLRGQVRD